MTDTSQNTPTRKALVTVFEDLETAHDAILQLRFHGFRDDQLELVTHSVSGEAPEISTPKVHDTTNSSMIEGSFDGGTLGLGIGAVAALVVPFPGLALGMIVVGGLTGSIVGAMAGIEHAVEDDSVNLPSVKEYGQLVRNGFSLVVVLGTHDEVMKAEEVIIEMPCVHSHTHVVQGHEFHEHPAKR